MKKITLIKIAFSLALLFSTSNAFAQIYPIIDPPDFPDLRDCSFGCTSNNFTIRRAYLVDGDINSPTYRQELTNVSNQTCNVTDPPILVSVGLEYTSNQNGDIHKARLFSTLTNGADIVDINPWLGTIQGKSGNYGGTGIVNDDGITVGRLTMVDSFVFNWSCGLELAFVDILTNWVVNENKGPIDENDPYSCSDYTNSQCQGITAILIQAPLSVDFDYNACFDATSNDTNVTFVNGSANGVAPFVYDWKFFENGVQVGSSSDEFPVFDYNGIEPYTVSLIVTDDGGNGISNNPALIKVIDVPEELLNTATKTDASCSGTGGSANFVASGGAPPFTFIVDTNTTGAIRVDKSPTEIEFNPAGTGTITITVTDATGCSSQSIVQISQEENIAPIIAGAIDDTNIDGCDTSGVPDAETTVAGLEGLPGDLIITDDNTSKDLLEVSSSDSPPLGTCPIIITRTYTVIDECEEESVSFVHTIQVNTPDFTLPADGSSIVECLSQAKVEPTPPDVDDFCGNPITPILKTTPSDISCEGTMTWVYTYTDCTTTNTHDWKFTYTIDLTTSPIAPANGSDTVECIEDATETFTLPVIKDVCGNTLTAPEAIVTENPDPFTCEGTRTYSYTYLDCAGNESVYTYTYTIDLLAFSDFPDDVINPITSVNEIVVPTPPQVFDNCDVLIVPSDPEVSLTPECDESIDFAYTYVDCSGYSAVWTYTYTIELAPFTVPTNGGAPVDCIADAIETFTLPIINDANGNLLTPSEAVVTDSPDPLTCDGTKTYTYNYEDCAGNTGTWAYVYTIVTPIFTITDVPGSDTVNCIADATETFIFPIIKDACGNTLTASEAVVTDSPDPLTCEGTRTYTYTYTDCANNKDTWAFVYTIDTPTFTITDIPGSDTVSCIADATETFTLPIIKDVCGNTLAPVEAVVTENPDPLTCEGTRTYTYTYTDCANNKDTWAFVYTIDTPTFTITDVPGSNTVDCIADATETFTLPIIKDVCGNTLTASEAVVTENPDPLTCEGTRTYTYTYTDCANNTDTWTYVYTVDTPIFILPDDVINPITSINEIVVPTPPEVFDNCGVLIVPSDPEVSLTPECDESIDFAYTYVDCSGYSAVWTYTYTIKLAPFTVPPNGGTPVNCITDATETFTLPIIYDANENLLTPSASVVTENPDPLTCEGTRTYTYTYTDCANNTDTWAFVYTIDTPTFTITDVPGSNTASCIADATETFTLPVIKDVCGNTLAPSVAVVTENPDPLTCEGTRTYTYTYTDCANNTDTWAYVYTIDTPTFTITDVPGSNIVDCIADATETFTLPVIKDVCGNILTAAEAVVTENPDPLTCEGTRTYTYTYTDCANNTDTWAYVYTIDTPVFSLPEDGFAAITSINEIIEPTPPEVFDNCGVLIIPSEPEVSLTPDCNGSLIYTYKYIDCSANELDWTFTYTITLDPFETPAYESSIVQCIEDAVIPTPPYVNDANGNLINPEMTESSDPDCEGFKIYTYTYTDCAMNTADWVYTYNINISKSPVVPEDGESTVSCLSSAVEPNAPVVIDACGNSIEPIISKNDDPDCEGEKFYIFTYTDCSGNSAVYTFTYFINDTVAPVFSSSLPRDLTVECSQIPSVEIVTAEDNCTDNVTIDFEEIPAIPGDGCIQNQTITRIWIATDCAGNSVKHEQIITLVDTTPPTIIDAPDENVTIICTEIPDPYEIKAVDNCSLDSDITIDFSENTSPPDEEGNYQIIRAWVLKDECGNESPFVQTINVEEYSLVIAENTVICDDDLPFDFISLLSATDPTDGIWSDNDNTGAVSGSLFDPAIAGLGTYNFTYSSSSSTGAACNFTQSFTMTVDRCIVLPCSTDDIAISRVVTPNGDSHNEYFEISGLELCGFIYDIIIFNRWGALVYQSVDYQNNWRGYNLEGGMTIGSSTILPTGTYYYVVKVLGTNDGNGPDSSAFEPITGYIYLSTN